MSDQVVKSQDKSADAMLASNRKRDLDMRHRKWQKCKDLIGAIDQGTSSTRFLVFENETGQLIASSQIDIKRIVPKEGWVEMDPKEIMNTVYATIQNVHEQITSYAIEIPDGITNICDELDQLKCVGICNQRESTVIWDRLTGEPFYNVIVWLDNRTKDIVDEMIDSAPGRDFNHLKDKTGLPMSTYFSAFKLKWLIDNVPKVKQAMKENRLLFGTVDTWILWNLTGQHLTDVTNASRTFLMDIETLEWDKTLCKFFGISMNILPKICASADDFGVVQNGPLKGVPITGVIGDQSAALFGHNCLQLGQTKATFGTGCFVMQNIGPGPLNGALSGVNREARRGLVTTVGYKLRNKPAHYALEGSVKIAGAALTWLRDNLQLINDYSECDILINKTTNSAGVFFVPALGGLYSPYWDPNASGLFIGLSQFTRREHLIRATFDSIAFQTNDILNLMRGVTNGLMIDGGLCKSENMCQILADITGCEIVRPSMTETSALGAAMIAGYGAGLWSHEKMLDRSNSPFGFSSSTHQTHHYPHKTLHYEDKFFSLLSTMNSTPTSQHQQNADATNNDCCNTSSGLSTESESVSDSIDDEEEREVLHASAQSENLLDSIATGTQVCSLGHASDTFYQTPSSGYSSGDNYEAATNSACDMRRDTPISSSQMTSGKTLDGFENEDSSKEVVGSRVVYGDGDGGGCHQVVDCCYNDNNINVNQSVHIKTFPTNYPESYSDYELEQNMLMETKSASEDLKDNDLSLNSDRDLMMRRVGEGGEENSETVSAERVTGDDDDYDDEPLLNEKISRIVDVFQSYISLEHRTELVNTWRLAVERSMKWTKIDHEEIRRIDYQRLSALPLSMYLFFSIGIFAISEFLSGRIKT